MNNDDIHPFNPFKILSAYNEIKTILEGKFPAPKEVELYISHACNQNCINCHSEKMRSSEPIFLTSAHAVIDELAAFGISSIELGGGGEPMLHPKFVRIIGHARRKGIKTGLLTNGTLIDKSNVSSMLDALSFIRVSINAVNAVDYEKIHGHDDFEKVVNNLTLLIEERNKRSGADTPAIGIKYLVSALNHRESAAAVDFADRHGADYIQFKQIRNSDYGTPPDLLEKTEKAISDRKNTLRSGLLVISRLSKTRLSERCILNPLYPAIDAAGNVGICWRYINEQKHIFGNIHESSFKDIWHSNKHTAAFNATDAAECSRYDCQLHSPNEIVRAAIIKNKMHLDFI